LGKQACRKDGAAGEKGLLGNYTSKRGVKTKKTTAKTIPLEKRRIEKTKQRKEKLRSPYVTEVLGRCAGKFRLINKGLEKGLTKKTKQSG